MKKYLMVSLCALTVISLSACGNKDNKDDKIETQTEEFEKIVDGESVHNDDAMFIRHRLEDGYSILEERSTGVCYFEYKYTSGNRTYYGLTCMINPDGTAKVWER